MVWERAAVAAVMGGLLAMQTTVVQTFVVPHAPRTVIAGGTSSRTLRMTSNTTPKFDTEKLLNDANNSHRWDYPTIHNVCDETGITLNRYLLEMVKANPELAELESIFVSIQTAVKTISRLVNRAPLTGIMGLEGDGGSVNVQGEEQKKLDVITNRVLKKALSYTGKVGTLASEEEDNPVLIDAMGNPVYSADVLVEQSVGGFVAVFDPLDGSSNVDAGIPTGTIFGIFETPEECELPDDTDDWDAAAGYCLSNALQPGANLAAAGYALYSSSTSLVFTLGNGVQMFTLDENIGEFVLTQPDLRIPSRGKIYSMNESNRHDWDEPLREYVDAISQGKGASGKRYSARYIGSMVADVHRTLQYGGIFGYPADGRNPNGKLRLLYEAAPMAFLVEQAGGLALTGRNRILTLKPKSTHQRVPCILGSPEDVAELQAYYNKSTDEALKARCDSRLG